MSDASISPRPAFYPVDTSSANASRTNDGADDVESPSLASGNALARFEFEPGKGKDGTKVLMVEWEEDSSTQAIAGEWEISWEGKRTVLPAREHEAGDSINRLYFLLGAGVAVPAAVQLRKGDVRWRANPLPALFPPELGATARQAGKKGVLHTIWAKKRLQVLQKEIETEAKDNAEGIGYEMALAEKEWIEAQFGVLAKPMGMSIAIPKSNGGAIPDINSPTSPKSPGGGRLMEKLKGLKLGTSEQALSPTAKPEQKKGTTQTEPWQDPLSPEISDVAVGSFGSFAALKGMQDASSLAARPAQVPSGTPTLSKPQQRKMAPQRPPESFAARQTQTTGIGSLNALAAGGATSGIEESAFANRVQSTTGNDEEEEDLFALPMSPRSPEMTKSPFSFAKEDTMKYLKEDDA